MSEVRHHQFDLPEDRPASFDETGHRVYIHPSDTKGPWRLRRTVLYAVLLVIFLVLPWVRLNGHQALLLDVAHRRFAVFGLTFWAHDAPMLLFVIGGFAISLLFATAVLGRVWCGWACPQTVFIDMVFRRIEGWVEGKPHERRKLDLAPMSAGKAARKGVKWALFTAAALVIAHSFLAYFVGTEELMRMVRTSPAENPASFLVMLGAAGITLFDFGWFREQFCMVACPYGRLQSVLMDETSLAPLYDVKRGEPRKFTPGVANDKVGDCISCYRCVQVCPTGVDIRRGVQLECVACTACIDACDEVMDKLKKPHGLIRYDSITGMQGEKRSFSIRSVLYFAILCVILVGLGTAVATRKPYQMTINRAPDAAYAVLSGGDVVNHLRLHMANQTFESELVTLRLADHVGRYKIVMAKNVLPLVAGESSTTDVFITFDPAMLDHGTRAATLEAVSARGALLASVDVKLLGPEDGHAHDSDHEKEHD
jgi:cytochrome c oxidase accessory protein FixG